MDENSQEYQRVFDLLFQLGKTYLEKGRYDEAIEKLTKLTELGEENEQIYLILSKAYILKEQYDDKALQIFRKTLEYDPENKVINILLSQIYLGENREDDEAYRVYRNAIQHNPPNTKDLALALIKIDYKKGNYQSAKALAEQVIKFDPKNSELISYYTYLGWQQETFDEISETLKGIIRRNGDQSTLKWLVLNYLKKVKSNPKCKFGHEDIQYCDKYLESIDQFTQLNEIYIYISLKKIIRDFYSQNNNTENSSISEYELFLTENSLSDEKWDRGLNKALSFNRSFNFSKEIWNRITPIIENTTESFTDNHQQNQTNRDEDWAGLNTVMIIQLANYDDSIEAANLKEFFTEFDSIRDDKLDNDAAPIFKRTADGYVIFWKDTAKAVSGAVDILNSSFELKLKFNIYIHQIMSDELLTDLITLFEIQQLCNDILSSQSTDEIYFNEKICITEPVYNLVKKNRSTKLIKKISVLNIQQEFAVYEVLWEDPLDRIRKGVIKKLDRFQIMNEVYLNDVFNSFKAVDTFLDRMVMLKVLRPDCLNAKQSQSSNTFLKAARKIGKLNHNNVAIIYDISEDQNFFYIAREFIEGGLLTDMLTAEGKIDWQQSIEICLQIGEGLNYAHKNGIIHGRLKPSNIFISETQEIKIADFTIPGFSVPVKNQKAFDLYGISYASPEQIATKKDLTEQSDIYSLGVVLYALLTNGNPFYDEDSKKLFNNIKKLQPPKVLSKNPDVPTEIDSVVEKAIAKSPDDRYENVGEFMAELRNML